MIQSTSYQFAGEGRRAEEFIPSLTDLTTYFLFQDKNLERYMMWLKDKEVTKYLDTTGGVQSPEAARQYVKRLELDPKGQFFAITLPSKGFVGTLRLHSLDVNKKQVELGLMVGDRSCWGKGVGTTAIGLGCDLAAARYHVNEVSAGSYLANRASVRAFERNGFEIKAIMPVKVAVSAEKSAIVRLSKIINVR